MRRALGDRYGVVFDSVGFNLYRDGRDSVAWHRDRILAAVVDPVVALVSLGGPRRLLLRPLGGGARSRVFHLGRGDLFVTGGTATRAFEHHVPKVAHAEPRISLAFRHGVDPRASGRSAFWLAFQIVIGVISPAVGEAPPRGDSDDATTPSDSDLAALRPRDVHRRLRGRAARRARVADPRI